MARQAPASRWLGIAEGLLECPTAPCLEHAPAEYVREFARRRTRLALSEDRYGNLIVKWPGQGRPKGPPLVLVAHLDHPGFVVERVSGKRAHLEFRGGVKRRHAKPGTRLDFFRPGETGPLGRGRLVSASSKGARRAGMLGSAVAEITAGAPEAGDFTMWSFPGFSEKRARIVSRCLDDLLGAACILAVLDEVHRRELASAHVWGLFTRAEEIGLLGALAAIRARSVPKNARVLSLETSRFLPHARQGDGVIVRVGDVRSLFDPRLTGVLHDEAAELAKEDPSFRFQRRLMDGGACEATAFCAAGYRCGGLALPLGNYHNMKGLDGGSVGIGAEYVRTSDYVSEIQLLLRLAERSAKLPELESKTESWLEALSDRAHDLLSRRRLDSSAKAGRR